MILTMKDGGKREVAGPASAIEIIKNLSNSLAKAALAVKIDDEVKDLSTVVDGDCAFQVLTADDPEALRVMRHTASHVLAQAVLRLRPNAKFAIGPAIDNGFYYDFDLDEPLTAEDFPALEKEMARIIKANSKLERFELPREEAIAFMQEQNQPYKVELIRDLPEDAVISFYKQDGFTDLCAGPHMASTGKVKAVKILNVAGAYWRGSEKNKMLQRVYATAFFSKEELDAYLNMLEEAKKRDHRRIGKELGLFATMDEGPGFPFFFPKGYTLRTELEAYWRRLHKANGYVQISTPLILSRDLWLRSGHWDHYKDNMYTVKIDDEDYAIKPMNCPGGMLVYKSETHSYRELPLRVAELGTVHRHELSGALHGLMRVRCFTQDDAHIFMTPDQIEDEIFGVIRMATDIYKTFGFEYFVELSTRPEDSMGSDEDWERATNALRGALDKSGMPYKINEGDGAFYGPKIDFHLRDCIGRDWQCGTIQLDMQMPERFDLTYVGADGEKHRPVMIHRTLYGSIERFIGIVTEQFAGAFPLWLAPVQATVLTITNRGDEYAKEVARKLDAAGIRVETDLRNEKINFKKREAWGQKVPYILVVGDQEVADGTVAVSKRGGEQFTVTVDEFIAMAKQQITDMVIF